MKKNKIISAVTAAAVAFTAFGGIIPNAVPEIGESISVSAADTKTGECGRKVTWTLDNEGILTISGTGDMYDYGSRTEERPSYYEYAVRGRINNVVIKKGVAHIGAYAFANMGSLTEITIPDGVKSIGDYAFSKCGLTDITFGNDLEYIGKDAFLDNYMVSVTLPDGVKMIDDQAFYNCFNLRTVKLPDGIRRISDSAFQTVFLSCIESTDGIKYIGNCAYSYDSSHKAAEIKIKDGTTYIAINALLGRGLYLDPEKGTRYTDEEYMEVIKNTVIPDSVAAISEWAFDVIPEPEYGVSYIGSWAISGEEKVTAVNIKEGTKGIADNAFSSRGKLTGVTVPESVKHIGYKAFSSCGALDAIVINNPECEIFDRSDTISTGKDNHDDYYFTGTIYGYSNSTAQAYAEKYDYDFKALDEGAVPPEITAPEPLPELPKGDANGDGKFDIRDAMNTVTHVAAGKGGSYSAEIIPEKADFNEDGKVNVRDPGEMAKKLANNFHESGLSLKEYISEHQPEPSSYELNGESLSISSAKVYPGYIATVSFNVSCNNNFGSMDIIASFNKKLQVRGTQANIDSALSSDYGTGYVTMALYGSCPREDGSVATIDFTIPDNAKIGDVYNIDVALVKTFSTFDGEDIAAVVPVSGGTITVIDPNAPYEPEVTTTAATTAITTTTTTTTTTTAVTTTAKTTKKTKATTTEITTTSAKTTKAPKTTTTAKTTKTTKTSKTTTTAAETTSATSSALVEAPKIVDSGTCGEDLTWDLYENGTLVISGSGDMDNYNIYGDDSPFYNRTDIKRVIVTDGVTSIGGYAFYNCTSLTDIEFSDSVTKIGADAFYGCKSLTCIALPDGVTRIEDSTFNGCENLTDITIPEGVTLIGDCAFNKCTSLTGMTLPDSLITLESGVFYLCKNLKDINIPENVTRISVNAFTGCDSLTSIIIPESVKKISSEAFSECDSLTSITIKNPECDIEKAGSTISNGYEIGFVHYFNGTIYGYEGSTAQAYAEKLGYKFESLGDAPGQNDPAATTDPGTTPVGDANGDGKLNVRDAANIAYMLAVGRVDELPPDADFNGDGKVNVRDAAAIAKYLATGKK